MEIINFFIVVFNSFLTLIFTIITFISALINFIFGLIDFIFNFLPDFLVSGLYMFFAVRLFKFISKRHNSASRG